MNRLRQLRKQADISQQQLAEKARVSINTVRALESGRVRPLLDTARAIAQALGVSPDDIWPPNPQGT